MPRIDQTFHYDDHDRLVSETGPAGTARYGYDPADNRVAVEVEPTRLPPPPPHAPSTPALPDMPLATLVPATPEEEAPPARAARPVGLACGACSEPVARDDRFCRSCGARLQ